MSMLPGYDRMRRNGRAKMDARPRIIRETPVSALVDGGGGLGHVPAHFAMQVAIDKAKQSGMAIAAVNNSAHFGATGYYTLMAAKAGLIGMACTSASGIQVAPTFGKQARLGTDPWSFAAPTADGQPVPARHGNHHRRRRPHPQQGERGPADAGRLGAGQRGPPQQRPAGGTREGRVPHVARRLAGEFVSYKGYGLAAMVNILGSCLSGATLITDPMHTKKPQGMDIGHFFMAIDPGLFRDRDEFAARRRAVLRRFARDHADGPGAAGDGGRRSAMELRGEAHARRAFRWAPGC